jgi:hypothetical protein
MKLKLKGRRFESIEEIQAESQDVLKMLMQIDFHQCTVLTQKGTTLKKMEANKNFNKWLSIGRQIFGTLGSTSYLRLMIHIMKMTMFKFLARTGIFLFTLVSRSALGNNQPSIPIGTSGSFPIDKAF